MEKLIFSDQLIRTIFDSLSAHIVIIDENGHILETNLAWRHFSQANGFPESLDFQGLNYLTVCDGARDEGADDARHVAQGIRGVLEKKTREFLYDYPCHSPQGLRWFYMRAVLMADSESARVIISHEDITELKQAQESLKEHQTILEDRNQSLEEANVALRVLIRQRETDKVDMEKNFLTHIKTFVLPYLGKLKASSLGEKDRTLVGIVEDQLKEVTTPLMKQLSNANVMLTPQEMQVAALVKDGKTTAQIADILYVSEATVSFHRKNLRTKLGLRNKQANLRSFLLSMT